MKIKELRHYVQFPGESVYVIVRDAVGAYLLEGNMPGIRTLLGERKILWPVQINGADYEETSATVQLTVRLLDVLREDAEDDADDDESEGPEDGISP